MKCNDRTEYMMWSLGGEASTLGVKGCGHPYLHGKQHSSTYISGRLMAEDKASSVTPICADRVEIQILCFSKLVARKVGRVSCSRNNDAVVRTCVGGGRADCVAAPCGRIMAAVLLRQ